MPMKSLYVDERLTRLCSDEATLRKTPSAGEGGTAVEDAGFCLRKLLDSSSSDRALFLSSILHLCVFVDVRDDDIFVTLSADSRSRVHSAEAVPFPEQPTDEMTVLLQRATPTTALTASTISIAWRPSLPTFGDTQPLSAMRTCTT